MALRRLSGMALTIASRTLVSVIAINIKPSMSTAVSVCYFIVWVGGCQFPVLTAPFFVNLIFATILTFTTLPF